VTVAELFGQTLVLLPMATIGNGITVIVADPVNDCEQAGVVAEIMLTRL
jgi:hypothetical protein